MAKLIFFLSGLMLYSNFASAADYNNYMNCTLNITRSSVYAFTFKSNDPNYLELNSITRSEKHGPGYRRMLIELDGGKSTPYIIGEDLFSVSHRGEAPIPKFEKCEADFNSLSGAPLDITSYKYTFNQEITLKTRDAGTEITGVAKCSVIRVEERHDPNCSTPPQHSGY